LGLENVIVVLHRPSSAENLGAVARVLRNFGLSRLSVVEPPSWGGKPRSGKGESAKEDVLLRARKTARKASPLLARAEFHPDLASALSETTWACGTTSRMVMGRRALSPRELGRELAARASRGLVALVLGEERRGLSDAELALCPAVCTIPTSSAYDSMNLAQAAAVLAYEAAWAAGARVPKPSGKEPVRHRTVEALWAQLGVLLGEAGYLNPQNPAAILAEWRRLLARAEPSQREVELLLAAARALERRLRLG